MSTAPFPHPGEQPPSHLYPVPILPARPHLVDLHHAAQQSALAFDRDESPGALLSHGQYLVSHMAVWGKTRGSAVPPTAILDAFYQRLSQSGPIEEVPPASAEGTHPSPLLAPPLLAWAEAECFGVTPDLDRLARVVPVLEEQMRRVLRGHRVPGRGVRYSPDPTWANGGVAPTAMAALNSQCLSHLALLVGLDEIGQANALRYLELKDVLNELMWDDSRDAYCDIDADDFWAGPVAAGMYWTLLADAAPPPRRDALIRHLRDFRSFARSHMVPSVAAKARDFSPRGNPYRGGVWPSATYMVVRGLEFCGEGKLAHHIALNHLDNVAQVRRDTGKFWDYYAPDHAEPGRAAPPMPGGYYPLVFSALLMEGVLGLSVDATRGAIHWNLLLEDQMQGVHGLRVGDTMVNLRADQTGRRTDVTLVATGPVVLEVSWHGGGTTLRLGSAGEAHARLC